MRRLACTALITALCSNARRAASAAPCCTLLHWLQRTRCAVSVAAAVAGLLAAIEALHARVPRAFEAMRVSKAAPRPPPVQPSLEAEITAPKDTCRVEPLLEGPVATNARLRTCGYAPLGCNPPCAKAKRRSRKGADTGYLAARGSREALDRSSDERRPRAQRSLAGQALAYSPVGGSPR